MKLVHLLTASLVLASTTVMAKTMETSKTVIYQCQNNTEVVASYEFKGEKATGLTLTVNDMAVKGLMRDSKNKEFTSFKTKGYVWNLEPGFTLATFAQKDGIALFKQGKQSDQMLAKDCVVDVKKTAGLN